MKFDTEELIREGLLRKIPVSKQKIEESIKTAESWLKEAEINLKNKLFRSGVLSCYNAMFHASRAILFKDGLREKSHFAVARYLEDKYANKNLLEMKWINILDFYREERHENQYSTSFISSEEEAEKALKNSKEFVERIKKIIREEQCQQSSE